MFRTSRMLQITASFIASLLLPCSQALAQSPDLVLSNGENAIVKGYLCVGYDCNAGGVEQGYSVRRNLRIKDQTTGIHFMDTSPLNSGFPSNDWNIFANDSTIDGLNYLAFKDEETANILMTLRAGARDNAIYLAPNGFLGFGTNNPLADLHLTSFDTPRLRFEQRPGSFSAQTWDIGANENAFSIRDVSLGTFPFYIRAGAPAASIDVKSNGNVGLGTSDPEGKLHVKGNGVQLSYLESGDGGAVQLRFRTNSENRRFLAVNNLNQVKSQIVFGDNQIQFLGQTIANEWLRISDAGIVSSGPTCNPNPCDATFDPEVFTVPPIEERAAYMWENMHLPAVGPTAPDQPFNVTEKLGGVIHELEVAHIYIAELHSLLEAEQARNDDHATQIARLNALVDRLTQENLPVD